MNYPAWAGDDSGRVTYLLRLAALQHNQEASIPALAKDCGLTPESFYMAARRGSVTPGMAAAIVDVIGRGVVTKEMLCPEKFTN